MRDQNSCTFRASPTGFFAYPSVKTIQVPAFTNAGGRLTCAITSVYTTGLHTGHLITFKCVNFKAEACFGTVTSSASTTTYLQTLFTGYTLNSLNDSVGTSTGLTTTTRLDERYIVYITHNPSYPVAAEIKFPTPILLFSNSRIY